MLRKKYKKKRIDLKEITELRKKSEQRERERERETEEEEIDKKPKGFHHNMLNKMPFFYRPYYIASSLRKTRNICYIQKKKLRACIAFKGIKTLNALKELCALLFRKGRFKANVNDESIGNTTPSHAIFHINTD